MSLHKDSFTCVIFSGSNIVPLALRRIEGSLCQASKDLVLVEVLVKRLLGHLADYLAQQQKPEIGVLELGANWELWLCKGDILQYFLSSPGNRIIVVIGQA